MKPCLRVVAGAAGLLVVCLIAGATSAQKPGGVLQISHRDSPGEHVDARGGDDLDRRPDDGGVQ